MRRYDPDGLGIKRQFGYMDERAALQKVHRELISMEMGAVLMRPRFH